MAEINAVDISELMSKWGKKGGSVRSEKKAAAARRNLALRQVAQSAPAPAPEPGAVPHVEPAPISQPETRRTVPVLFAPRKSGE